MTSCQWFWLSNATSLFCVALSAIGMMSGWDTWGWYLLLAALTAKSPPGYASCSCKLRKESAE